jgi:hypothetical protein
METVMGYETGRVEIPRHTYNCYTRYIPCNPLCLCSSSLAECARPLKSRKVPHKIQAVGPDARTKGFIVDHYHVNYAPNLGLWKQTWNSYK